MNEKGEKTCPLCAEEMDLTDQHLKPCKCGYQICVWCWHHITEMAEKDKTESCCPACRTPYDKEKIVGMTVSRERLAAEHNNDRKKSQKVKPKPSEGRKELIGVRVIQRNLVYVMSLPFDLANEDLFQRREYFGQYGKVVKVAMSRTAAGDVQQFPNNTCSVYITYSKEEEAIRCIQSVHKFILDGRSLKACFGTRKYCHVWLRNMSCTNSECLYLHEMGSEEDSFTKEETISVHMREIIQKITGAVNNYPWRSGSMLPPPVDDHVDNESRTRKVPKCGMNNAHIYVKSSSPNGRNGQSVTLPAGALWGMKSSNQSSFASVVTTNSTHSDVLKKPVLEDNHTANGNALKPRELLIDHTDFPELSLLNRTQISNSRAVDCSDFPEHTSQSCETMMSNGNKKMNRMIQSVCSLAVSVDADSVVDGHLGLTRSGSSRCDHASIKSSLTAVSGDSIQCSVSETKEVQQLQKSSRTDTNEVVVSREGNAGAEAEIEDDISLFNRQRLMDPEVLSCQPNVANKTGLLRTSNCKQPCSYKAEHDETRTLFGFSTSGGKGSNRALISHGHIETPFREPTRLNGSLNHSMLFPEKARDTQLMEKCSIDSQGNSRSEIEDMIIANILSLDLDEYITSPHNSSKLLRAGVDEARSYKQSRFPFARREESKNGQAFESYNVFNQISHGSDFHQSSTMDMLGMYNGSSYKTVPRYPVAAPPGFSVPSQPPPRFPSNGREQQIFNGFSGSQHLSDTKVFGNQNKPIPIQNSGGLRDVHMMDPTGLVVGQGFEKASLDFRSKFQGNRMRQSFN